MNQLQQDLRARVRNTSAVFANSPIYFGHIDIRAQAEVANAQRPTHRSELIEADRRTFAIQYSLWAIRALRERPQTIRVSYERCLNERNSLGKARGKLYHYHPLPYIDGK